MRILLNESPRSLAVISGDGALLIRDPAYFLGLKQSSYLNSHHHASGTNAEGSQGHKNVNNVKQCVVELIDRSKVDLKQYINVSESYNVKCLGILGLISINEYSFLVVITKALEVGSPRTREKVYQVQDVEFICLNSNEYDRIFTLRQHSEEVVDGVVEGKEGTEQYYYPWHDMRKLIIKGNFYFSNTFDLTNNIQNREANMLAATGEADTADRGVIHVNKQFLWNHLLIDDLVSFRNRLDTSQRQRFDESKFLCLLIRGFVQTLNTDINLREGQQQESLITLISKIGVAKSGKIFGPSGLDDSGKVANYIETEVIFYNENYTISYSIVRGNIPIYFEIDSQQSSSLLKKISINRPFDATQEAFKKHFDYMCRSFGEVGIVNELSSSISLEELYLRHTKNKGIEFEMYKRYHEHYLKLLEDKKYRDLITMKNFNFSLSDLSKSNKAIDVILHEIKESINNFATFTYDNINNNYLNKQSGIFRLSSFDVLDKCNELSKIISKQVMFDALTDSYLYDAKNYYSRFSPYNQDLYSKLDLLWKSNNNALNKILGKYNTELKQLDKKDRHKDEVSDLHRKKTKLLNSFTGLTVSTSKKLFNLSNYKELLNDLEKRNIVLSVVLGKESIDYNNNLIRRISLYDPVNDYVQSELKKLTAQYMSKKEILIYSGTFNVGGTLYDGDLTGWLFPNPDLQEDIFFIGLQEIVELTAGKMINIDVTNRHFWEKKILHEINKNKQKYILLWSGCLGGLLSLIFIKDDQVKFINKIEESMKKTGLGGMAANKGGIALSFQYSNTSFCFITCHLAAGLNNIEERHQNYKSLSTGLRFSENRTIKNHDNIIWLGDFNYRIEMKNDEVRSMIIENKLEALFQKDQLNNQMESGESFPYYEEYGINFKPTYKFNPGEDTYDLSEKMRIPAWCDRIVKRGPMKQLNYGSNYDIRFSDHRPVYGLFNAEVIVINQKVKRSLANELYVKRKAKFGNENYILSKNLSQMIKIDTEDGENSLPPPSTDKLKWWFNNGQLATVDLFTNVANIREMDIKENSNPNGEFEYREGMYINENRPENPFVFTEELDFIYPQD